MPKERLLIGWVALSCCAILGCGSGSGPPSGGPPRVGHTVQIGSLTVGTASAAGFKTLTLSSPAGLPVAFTALYGSRILRLEEIGYGKIAFASYVGGQYDVYVMNADGTNPVRLTTSIANDWQPAWSPDGKRIVYSSKRSGNYDIWSMNADGSGAKRLTGDTAPDARPDWSPNGQQIVFDSDRTGSGDIYVMDADGTHETRLTTQGFAESAPAWSPDGRQIAFFKQWGGRRHRDERRRHRCYRHCGRG